jgi:hypothetical protein
VFLRYEQFVRPGRSPIGIAQALIEHWSRTLDSLPPALATILQEVGDELLCIDELGFDEEGEAIHHLQLEAYEAALYDVLSRGDPEVTALLQPFYQRYPTETVDALTDLLRVVEQDESQRATALAIFRLVHTQARRWYLQYQTDTFSDPDIPSAHSYSR